jgi:hypothetical protein
MAKPKLFFVAENPGHQFFDAGFVRYQQEEILLAHAATALQPGMGHKNYTWSKLLRWINCYKLAAQVNTNDIVYFHFPYRGRAYEKIQALVNKKACTVAVVIDIDGLRDQQPELLEKEIKQLSTFSIIVAHNSAMLAFLQQKLPGKKIVALQVFDYPQEKLNPPRAELINSICFAGNLNKSDFIQYVNQWPSIHWHLYGQGQVKTNSHITHHGVFLPKELPGILQGYWGLVWDGNSTLQAHQYLRYNSPHKLSLYLSAGKPLIVWRQSALAAWVANTKTGILIEKIEDIPGTIEALPPSQLQTMQIAVQYWQLQVTRGNMLSQLLDKLGKS